MKTSRVGDQNVDSLADVDLTMMVTSVDESFESLVKFRTMVGRCILCLDFVEMS